MPHIISEDLFYFFFFFGANKERKSLIPLRLVDNNFPTTYNITIAITMATRGPQPHIQNKSKVRLNSMSVRI